MRPWATSLPHDTASAHGISLSQPGLGADFVAQQLHCFRQLLEITWVSFPHLKSGVHNIRSLGGLVGVLNAVSGKNLRQYRKHTKSIYLLYTLYSSVYPTKRNIICLKKWEFLWVYPFLGCIHLHVLVTPTSHRSSLSHK